MLYKKCFSIFNIKFSDIISLNIGSFILSLRKSFFEQQTTKLFSIREVSRNSPIQNSNFEWDHLNNLQAIFQKICQLFIPTVLMDI
ncbi:hypothetical protein QE382_002493 [Sphingobacterium zeae]|uniref:Uncharacterized protein n=1 Tax=Sphingobacterium zeae TaxID=1776859 RepID=A0ABU0U6C3_9SPHI|nr:hypothetical protein [Sphingobacterium zeae]